MGRRRSAKKEFYKILNYDCKNVDIICSNTDQYPPTHPPPSSN